MPRFLWFYPVERRIVGAFRHWENAAGIGLEQHFRRDVDECGFALAMGGFNRLEARVFRGGRSPARGADPCGKAPETLRPSMFRSVPRTAFVAGIHSFCGPRRHGQARLGHVTLEQRQAAVGAAYKAVFRVPHGCDGSPTIAIRVRIPEGVLDVKPMPKPAGPSPS